jgi:hypothetical protein
MDIATKACDVCGRQKQAVNHWLVLIVNARCITFYPASMPFESVFESDVIEDICGADCAHKRFSQWLTQQGI